MGTGFESPAAYNRLLWVSDIDEATAKRILDLPMPDNDADAKTVREYLIALLQQLWIQGDGFSSKRPFGNSGWEADLYVPLIRAGLIKGTLDELGVLDNERDFDSLSVTRLIRAAIDQLR